MRKSLNILAVILLLTMLSFRLFGIRVSADDGLYICCSSAEASSYCWKLAEGIGLGDSLEFGSSYTLSNDTIYCQSKAVGVVTELREQLFSNDVRLVVEHLTNDVPCMSSYLATANLK